MAALFHYKIRREVEWSVDSELLVYDFDGWELPDDFMNDLKIIQDFSPTNFRTIKEFAAELAAQRFTEDAEA